MRIEGLRVSLRNLGDAGSLGDRAAFAHVFLAGEYDFLFARMSPGDVVMDAGSNIGCFALRAARQVGPNGLVIAVEPEPSNAACLMSNIRLNDLTNVVVVAKALAAVPDMVVDIVGTGTTAYVDDDSQVARVLDPTAGTSRADVSTTTLDALLHELSLDRLDVMKMDIEGAESSVFADASTSSALATTKAVAVEVHGREGANIVKGRLRSDGFSYLGHVTQESGFLMKSIRRGIKRPDLVLKLYGAQAGAIAFRMASGPLRNRALPAAQQVGMVYASR